MNTPLPISIRSRRGLQSKLKLNDLDIPVHKSTLRTYELPENTVAISISDMVITYRYTQVTHKTKWGGGSTYAQIQTCINANPHTGKFNVYYTGMTTSNEDHDKFMDTYKMLRPVMEQLFCRSDVLSVT